MTERKEDKKRARSKVKTFKVPFSLGELKETIPFGANILTKSSKENLINQAFKFHSQGNISEAAKYYQSFINQGFKDHRVFSNYGSILKGLGKLKEAEASQRKAIELNPNFADAHSNLGNILTDLGKLEDAEVSQRKAIELNPNFANAYYNLGNILRDLGQLEDAEESNRKAIQLRPDFAEAHSSLGSILRDLGKLEEAKNEWMKAIKLDPTLKAPIEELSRRLYLDKEYNLAIKYLQENKSDNSQSLYLSCLLCLDREKEFNQKYNELAKKRVCNADMSGIIEHANIIYGTKKDSYFCNEALKYISIEKINKNLYSESHLQELISYLKDNKINTRPQSLTYKAKQTSGDLFSLNYPFIKSLKKVLEDKIKIYKDSFKDSNQGFIKNWPKEYSLRSWLLSMKTGGFIKPHNHRYGWITGSFYLQLPKNDDNKNAGNISFSYQGPEFPTKGKIFDSTIKNIETRDICIFPSSLFHNTIPFENTEERICLVFDLTKT